jgi:hypothetical protein
MKTIIAILFLGFTVNSFAQDQKPKSKPLIIEKGNIAPIRETPPVSTQTPPQVKAKKTIYTKKHIAKAQPIPSNLER